MRSPLKTELAVSARNMSSGRGEPPNRHLTWALRVLGAVVLLACTGVQGIAHGAPAAPAAARDLTLMRTSWYEQLRDFLKEELRRKGGDPERWPDSTIDDAPMDFVQAVYEEMGGDPDTLQLTPISPSRVFPLLLEIYVAVGGLEAKGTLIDELFDLRVELLWAYFEALGGTPLPE